MSVEWQFVTFIPQGRYRERSYAVEAVKSLEKKAEKREREWEEEIVQMVRQIPIPESLPKKSKSLKTIYDKLAAKYPDGVTIDVAESLQDDYPLEFGRLKPRSIQKGVRRAIDRKKREDAGF